MQANNSPPRRGELLFRQRERNEQLRDESPADNRSRDWNHSTVTDFARFRG